MLGIRQKLILGFGSLLAVILIAGLLTMAQIDNLGEAIDVILKENYRSVEACQEMKESLERIDSGLLYVLSGNELEGDQLIREYQSKFLLALTVQLNNITLPGEYEKTQQIKLQFEAYQKVIRLVIETKDSISTRQKSYFSTVQPLFKEIKDVAQEVLLMNQTSMSEANNAARHLAGVAHHRMLTAIIVSVFLVVLFSFLAHGWILKPINKLIESANEIRRGNLDLVLESGSKDEVGQLSDSFNEMASALRMERSNDRMNLIKTRRVTEDVFKVLPAAIAVIDAEGRVEVTTETAERYFGLKKGVLVNKLGYEWLSPLIQKALLENRNIDLGLEGGYVQQFIDNREYFFQPMAAPLPAVSNAGKPTGVTLILKDVTQVYEQKELKRDVVSTVSHQLKTPLTSIRMAIYLLLEEKIGSLNDSQTELLLVARHDSDRLINILDDLLNINHIGSGKFQVLLTPIFPHNLVQDAIEPILVEAKDKGVIITNNISDDLPEVMADCDKLSHVFTNLFSNAFRYTNPGGSVTVDAEVENNFVHFFITDTGKGIAREHIPHLFKQFYRVPGQDEKSGVGLGLSIVKEIINAHGGEVSIESELGKGSTLGFTLPLKNQQSKNS